jgi:hypothetical protein
MKLLIIRVFNFITYRIIDIVYDASLTCLFVVFYYSEEYLLSSGM